MHRVPTACPASVCVGVDTAKTAVDAAKVAEASRAHALAQHPTWPGGEEGRATPVRPRGLRPRKELALLGERAGAIARRRAERRAERTGVPVGALREIAEAGDWSLVNSE